MKGHQVKSLISEGYVKNHNHFFLERARALKKVHDVWDKMLEDLRLAEIKRIEQENPPAIPVGTRVRSSAHRDRFGTVVGVSVYLDAGDDDYYHPEEFTLLDESEVFSGRPGEVRGKWHYEVQMDPTENQAKRGRKGVLTTQCIDELEIVEEEDVV